MASFNPASHWSVHAKVVTIGAAGAIQALTANPHRRYVIINTYGAALAGIGVKLGDNSVAGSYYLRQYDTLIIDQLNMYCGEIWLTGTNTDFALVTESSG